MKLLTIFTKKLLHSCLAVFYTAQKMKFSIKDRSSHQRCSIRKVVFKNFAKFAGKTPEACRFIKKETLAQVFSCGFCEISNNTFLQNTSGRLLLQIRSILSIQYTVDSIRSIQYTNTELFKDYSKRSIKDRISIRKN